MLKIIVAEILEPFLNLYSWHQVYGVVVTSNSTEGQWEKWALI